MKRIVRIAANAALAAALSGSVSFAQNYSQFDVVTNPNQPHPGGTLVTDSQLISPAGFTRGSGTPWYVANPDDGLITSYDGFGDKQLLIPVPPSDPANKNAKGKPSGIVYNGSTVDFLLPDTAPATLVISTLDGTLAAWEPNETTATTVFRSTDGSSYPGLTSALDGDGHLRLFAANTLGRVDVFDHSFGLVKLAPLESGDTVQQPFTDRSLPRGYVPFNVQNIGTNIAVTYELLRDKKSVTGEGLGFVDIYTPDGALILRLQHGPWLNRPYGITLAPQDFGVFSRELLVANVGDGGTSQNGGKVAAFNSVTGQFEKFLELGASPSEPPGTTPLVIPGIMSLSPANSAFGGDYNVFSSPAAEIFFTSTSGGGLFGYLFPDSDQLVQAGPQ